MMPNMHFIPSFRVQKIHRQSAYFGFDNFFNDDIFTPLTQACHLLLCLISLLSIFGSSCGSSPLHAHLYPPAALPSPFVRPIPLFPHPHPLPLRHSRAYNSGRSAGITAQVYVETLNLSLSLLQFGRQAFKLRRKENIYTHYTSLTLTLWPTAKWGPVKVS